MDKVIEEKNELTYKNFCKKVGFISLGCDKNRVDTEKVISVLKNYSCFQFVGDKNEAEIIIINTCAFLESAREEAKNVIREMQNLKKEGNLQKLIVMGCLPLLEKDKILNEFDVDIVLIPDEYKKVDYEIFKSFGIKDYKKDNSLDCRAITTPLHYAYLKIADGCNNRCSYCKIPEIRGNYKSVPMEELVLEAEALCEKGVKEIILVAQDVTRYGCDIGTNIIKLIRQLTKIKKLSWLRLMYCYPDKITDELIKEIRDNPKIVKYLDIPMQHISNNVLSAMKRNGNKKYILSLIKKVRKEIKGVVIRTDFMVGFPNESEKDFKELCSFLKKYKLENVGFFKYSREFGTHSYSFKNQISEDVKDYRLKTIQELQEKIITKKNLKLKGKIFKVLCDSFDKKNKFFIGRPYFSTPEVDFEFLIIPNKKIKVGSFIDVVVLDFDKGYYIGEVL